MSRTRNMTMIAGIAMLGAVISSGFISCVRVVAEERPSSPPDAGWLRGTTDERIETLAAQLGGFDRTMMEVAYRYVELHFAGEAGNWDYAGYQLEEMRETMKLGLQRRPEHVSVSRMFMDMAIPGVHGAIEGQDRDSFRQSMQTLTANCNACHAMTEVPFIHVEAPRQRAWPWPMVRGE